MSVQARDALRAAYRDAWTALAMIRDAIEELGPVGALRSPEAVCCLDAPTLLAEAAELVRGIRGMARIAV